MLERRLSYAPLALVEIVETVTYYSWAIIGVALGAGVWALATGTVVRAICGAITMVYVGPVGFVGPRWNFDVVRPILPFGVRVQAAALTGFARDMAVNVGTAAIAGIAGLGLWSLAMRIVYAPAMLFEALWTVSYPAMARLQDAGEPPGPAIERAVRLTTLGAGILIIPLVAGAPALIPSVFGHQWEGILEPVTIVPLALLISGPISVATTGFLYAAGDAGSVLRALVANAVVYISAGLPLLALFGMTGLALGVSAGYLAETALLARATQRRVRVRLFSETGPLMLGAALIGVGVNVVTRTLEPTLPVALFSCVTALVLFVLLLAIAARPDMRQLLRVARGRWSRRRQPARDGEPDVARQVA